MAHRKSYRVTYERDADGWWVATAVDLPGCHTQGKSIGQARERLREAMELCDVPPTVALDEQIHIGGKLDAELEELKATREEAERLANASAEQTRKVAARLAKAGLSRRDVGELLGLSFQRVQQLIK
jgi:DNA-directed RNA polymerase specialized sigma subunit